MAAQHTVLARKAAEKHISFTDFVEELLTAERESRRLRIREMFARIAGSQRLKLDQYDSPSPPVRRANTSWSPPG